MNATRFSQGRHQKQRGAAALVVVMVLFFVVSLAAAYTSRNLIFEQRTSANQYRSTQALEAAEAGIEWALAMLNSGRITASCTASTSPTDTTFRERYLTVNTTPGSANFGRYTAVSTASNINLPSCVYNGTDWTCSCPTNAAPSLTAPSGAGTFPAFRVRLRSMPTGSPPGTVQIEANGCTRLDDTCLNPGFGGTALGTGNEGTAYVSVIAALTGGPVAAPVAALTALGTVNAGGTALVVHNGNLSTGGITVQAGGAINSTGLTLLSVPGTPGLSSTVPLDTDLAALGSARLFPAIFNVWTASFRGQPGLLKLDCSGSPCNAATLRTAISLNPGRPVWMASGLNIDSSGDIGSPTAPVTLVVSGSLNATTSGVTVHGLLYVEATDWTSNSPIQTLGAAIIAGNVGNVAGSAFTYDANLLALLRATSGSFVRLPGSWRDYAL